MIWLNKYKRSITCLVVFAYMFSASNCAPWLIDKLGDFGVSVTTGDYPCKGHDCGCSSVLQCLTDCCCVKPNFQVEKKTEGSCCETPPRLVRKIKSASCWSSDSATCEEPEEIVSFKHKTQLSAVGCRGSQKKYFQAKLTLHIYLPVIKILKYSPLVTVSVKTLLEFHPQVTSKSIDKIPIV
ncbi:MAG: hypothetical protein HRT88_09400 [Lentisphaeraceae bacterium]|nr:hypothetical protein [Lentisphaeraceae bacterium]